MMEEYQMKPAELSVHESGHAAMCLNFFIPFVDVNTISGEALGDLPTDPIQYWKGRLLHAVDLTHKCEWKKVTKIHKYSDGSKVAIPQIKVIPLTPKQKRENIISCKISLGGVLAEAMFFGSHHPWEWERKVGGTDLSNIETLLHYNMLTKEKSLTTPEEIAQALAELKAETRLLFEDRKGIRTKLWESTVNISRALSRIGTLTFTECWRIFDGEDI